MTIMAFIWQIFLGIGAHTLWTCSGGWARAIWS